MQFCAFLSQPGQKTTVRYQVSWFPHRSTQLCALQYVHEAAASSLTLSPSMLRLAIALLHLHGRSAA